MTREEYLVNLFLVSNEEGTDGDVSQALKDYDQAQRETIVEQRAEIARLREVLRDIVCAWAFIGGCNEVSRMIDKGRLILEEKNIALEEAL